MQIKDVFLIKAPQEEIWQFMFDVPRLGRCVPGIQALEMVGEGVYRGRLTVRVGPIRSEFKGTVTLTEILAPQQIAGVVEGDDASSASSIKATFRGALRSVEGGTEVSFQVEANVRGRLAQFGAPVITATAKRLTAEFAKNLKAELEREVS